MFLGGSYYIIWFCLSIRILNLVTVDILEVVEAGMEFAFEG